MIKIINKFLALLGVVVVDSMASSGNNHSHDSHPYHDPSHYIFLDDAKMTSKRRQVGSRKFNRKRGR